MNGYQIIKAIEYIPEARGLFLGCYTNNTFPDYFKTLNNGFFIANTQSDVNTFGHWIMFWWSNDRIWFWDSFSFRPEDYGGAISSFYNSFQGQKILAIKHAIQSDKSYVCGAYCIYFAFKMCRNRFKDLTNTFGRNRERNDQIVTRFFENLVGIKLECRTLYCPMAMFNQRCKYFCRCEH